jgi:hypothetical protein
LFVPTRAWEQIRSSLARLREMMLPKWLKQNGLAFLKERWLSRQIEPQIPLELELKSATNGGVLATISCPYLACCVIAMQERNGFTGLILVIDAVIESGSK